MRDASCRSSASDRGWLFGFRLALPVRLGRAMLPRERPVVRPHCWRSLPWDPQKPLAEDIARPADQHRPGPSRQPPALGVARALIALAGRNERSFGAGATGGRRSATAAGSRPRRVPRGTPLWSPTARSTHRGVTRRGSREGARPRPGVPATQEARKPSYQWTPRVRCARANCSRETTSSPLVAPRAAAESGNTR
jgi:hypothetical protein